MPSKEPAHLNKPRALVLLFALLQTSVAFLTDAQTFTHEESMWHYIGRNWFRLGLTPYAGGVDNKSPLIFAVFGLSDLLFGINYWFPRILGIVVQSAGLLFLYKTAIILADQKQLPARRTATITVTLYGLSVLWIATGGKYVSFTETYAVAFIIAAMYYYVSAAGAKKYFISGLLSGIAVCWRLSASFSVIAIIIHALFKRRNAVLPFVAGFLSGVGALLLLALAAGLKLHDIYMFAFADNFGGGSTTDHSFAWKLENFFNNFFYSELMLFYPAVIAYFFIKKQYSLLTIWLVCEFIGINLLGIYAHPHFKQLLPSLSLISGIAVSYLVHHYGVPFKQVLAVIWILFFPKITEPLTGLKRLIKGFPDRSVEYCTPPYPRTDEQSEKNLGLWIRNNTKPNDLVLVAGFGARVQLYSERSSPTIYFNVTQTQRAKSQLVHDIFLRKPQVIAVPLFPDYNKYVSKELRAPVDSLIAQHYLFDRCMYGYGIYRLNAQ